jgi:hypothetical protein
MIRFKSAVMMASALLLAMATLGMSDNKVVCEGFLPPNDMKIPVGDHSHIGMQKVHGGLTEQEYNQIMDRIEKMYSAEVQKRGGKLVVNRLWTDDTVNSSAEQRGGEWIINMYGGIARHPDVNVEGEALIACHEMGHHLGGAPKISGLGGAWASNEGESDYFATLKCLRVFFAQDDNSSIVTKATIDPTAKTQCLAQFTNQAEQDLCLRISMSGESVAYLFQDLTREKTKPNYNTPDKSQVGSTDDDHPATQCRMDTYFSGSLCTVAVSTPVSDSDYKAGSCVQGTDKIGWRPRCWFNPDSTGTNPGNPGNPGDPSQCPIGDKSLCDQLCQLDPTMPFCKK